MSRSSMKAAVLAGVLLLGALIPALAQQRGPGLVGDVNGDGRITSADALAVYAYLAGRPIPASFDVPGRGDADGDGQITRADAELIMRVAVGQPAGDRPVGKPAAPGTAPAEGPLRLQCVADVRANSVRCSAPPVATPEGMRGDRVIYGGQHLFVSVLTSDALMQADTFSFDLRVKNLLEQPIGTSDGTSVEPVKVFFASGIQNTTTPANNGVVASVNHDGEEAFTTSEPQKFFAYNEIVQPQATSSARRWKLRLDPGVQSFTFSLYVSSPVVHARGYVDVYPDSAEISAGATLQLSDTVRSALGRAIPGATVTWSSANTAVATVSANGIVTAVADGTVEITASNAPRTPGKMKLVVLTPSVDSSTFTPSPASLPVHDTSIVTLRLRSANGTPLTRSAGTVILSASSGALAVTDNGNGTYTGRLTTPTVGVVKVSGTLDGVAFSDTAEVTFTAGAAAGYVVTSSASTVAAGSPVTITAQTVDADSNAVAAAGTVINWTSTNGGSFATNTSVTDSAGVATVVFTTSTAAGVTHTVTATDSLSRRGTSGNITTQVGLAAKLAIVQQPTNTTAGASISPAVTVAVQDANGNVVTTATDPVNASIGSNAAGGTLTGTRSVTPVNGIATFSNLSIDKAGTGYTLAFSGTALEPDTSSAFNVTAGAAAKLVLVTQPADTVQSGAAFPRQPVVQLQDANGNPVAQADVSVVAAIATGGGTLGGTLSVNTSASGTATFTGLSIGGTVGDRTLSFSATGLAGVGSDTVSVTAGAAAQLAFSVQPSNTAAGAAIAPAVQVSITDASGNLVTGATDTVTVALGTNPSGGTLSGTATVAAVGGVATFSDLSIDRSGAGYTLGASSGSLTGTSAAFNVTAGAASHATSTITANPASIVADGASTSTITVQLRDANGNNLAAGGATVAISTSLGTVSATTDNGNGTYTATLTSGTTVASSVQVTATLNGSPLSNVATVAFTAGAAAGYVVSRSETTPVAGASVTLQAQLVDANGNAVPAAGRTVTWSSTNGGSFASSTSQTTSTGEATAVFTASTTAGTVHTVTATDGDGATGTSGTITTRVGAAARLGFVQQPGNAAAGASITPAVTVAIQDANGNTVTTATDNVTIAIGSNPGSGTLAGTATVAAVNGVAAFSDLSINKVGAGYTLGASSGGLTGATSGTFDVTPGAAAKLAFTVQPSNVVASAAIAPAVRVSILDAFDNLVTSATDNVTVAIGNNPPGGTLSGTATVAAVGGVATFADLSIERAGTGYTLAASSGGLPGATSAAFDVAAGAAAKLVITTQPADTAQSGTAFPRQPVVQLQDAAGNVVAQSGVGVTAAIASGGGTLAGTATVNTDASGTATFTGLEISGTVGDRTLSFTANTLAAATSNTVHVRAGAASQLTITTQPSDTVQSRIAFARQPVIQLRDAAGNPVAQAGVAVTAALDSAGGTLGGTATASTDANGVATFADLSIAGTAGSRTIAFSAAGLAGVASDTVVVTAGAAAGLAFTVQPANVVAGAALTPAVQLSIVDADSNVVTSASDTVRIAIGTNPGAGTLSGTAAVAAAGGVATFSGLSIDKVGTGYTLAASYGTLPGATSAAFDVTPGALHHFRIDSIGGQTANLPFTVTVTAQDELGNTVTSFAGTVDFSSTPAGGISAGGTSGAFTAGVLASHPITFGTTGTYTLTATLSGGTESGTSNSFEVQRSPTYVTWTGAVSTNWSDAGNWNALRVPAAGDTAVITATAQQPLIVDGDKTVLGLVMSDTSATTLGLGGFTLTVTGDVNAPTGTVSGGTLLVSGSGALVQGGVEALKVSGGMTQQGAVKATGAVSITGSLYTNGQPLTIAIP